MDAFILLFIYLAVAAVVLTGILVWQWIRLSRQLKRTNHGAVDPSLIIAHGAMMALSRFTVPNRPIVSNRRGVIMDNDTLWIGDF